MACRDDGAEEMRGHLTIEENPPPLGHHLVVRQVACRAPGAVISQIPLGWWGLIGGGDQGNV